ncbi:hypothetical protein [Litoribacter populi]|uniref:hypothetical protein n=1 Tax=Litoribacter populi TaxID=2598460 RepID=UPI00117D69A8|nr:hypothetical protein [Litoribacter populi]
MKNSFLSKKTKRQLGVVRYENSEPRIRAAQIIYYKFKQLGRYLEYLGTKTYRLLLHQLNPPPQFTTALVTKSGKVRLIDSDRMFVYSPKSQKTLLPLFLDDYFRFFEKPIITTAQIKDKHFFKERFYGKEQLHESYRCHAYFRQIASKYVQYLNYRKGVLMPDFFWGTMNLLKNTLKSKTLQEFIDLEFDSLFWAEQHLLYFPSHGNFQSEKVITCGKRYFILNLVDFGTMMPGFHDIVTLQMDLEEKGRRMDDAEHVLIEKCINRSFSEEPNLSPYIISFISWVFAAAHQIERQDIDIIPALQEKWERFYKYEVRGRQDEVA